METAPALTPRFYKSRYLSNPTVYIQEPTTWQSFAPGGVVTEHSGQVPETILQALEPISPEEAQPLLALLHANLHRLALEHAVLAPPPKLTSREWRHVVYAALAGLVVYLVIGISAGSLFAVAFGEFTTWMSVVANFVAFFLGSLVFALMLPRVPSWWQTLVFALGLVFLNALVEFARGSLDGFGLLVFGSCLPAFYGLIAGRVARLIRTRLRPSVRDFRNQ